MGYHRASFRSTAYTRHRLWTIKRLASYEKALFSVNFSFVRRPAPLYSIIAGTLSPLFAAHYNGSDRSLITLLRKFVSNVCNDVDTNNGMVLGLTAKHSGSHAKTRHRPPLKLCEVNVRIEKNNGLQNLLHEL